MKRAVFNLCLLALTGVLFIGCFNSLEDDEANLAIVWGNAGKFVNASELPGFRYDVVLRGEGLTLRHSFIGVPAAKFKVIPGVWSITVKGYGLKPQGGGMELKVMGIEQVKIVAGKNETKVMDIYTASEVGSWDELNAAINSVSTFTTREEIIVIKNSMTTGSLPSPFSGDTITIKRPITLIAENDVTIRNSSSHNMEFFTIDSGGSLTLGLDGMAGTITLDLSGKPETYNRIIKNTGSLILNNGVTIKNNNNVSTQVNPGGAIFVDTGGSFTMYGGNITGNRSNSYGALLVENGGGVYVDGSFTMYGGNINGNYAKYQGGGVYVTNTGKFIMHNGAITGNTAGNTGGGVYVATGGTFIQLGGIIGGNKPNDVYRE